jgi:hypothetical protein
MRRRGAILALALAAAGARAEPAQVIGWIEPVAVTDGTLVLDAKIDTGADVTSMHIDELHIERRGAEEWAVFTLRPSGGEVVQMEKRVVRYARVKRVAGGVQRRPVIHLALCLGSLQAQAEVNLVDRKTMRYPMLVGRRFLKDRFLVDSARTHTTTPNCAAKSG